MFLIDDFDSLFELMEALPDEQACIRHLEFLRWKGTIVSPFDESSTVYRCKNNKFRCRTTGRYFSVRTGTIFERSPLELRKWLMAIFIFLSHKKGISSFQLAKDIDVSQKTAWFMLQRIRESFGWEETDLEQLDGVVELDETFVGGKNKNRHADKKVERSQGRSFKDKTPVLGMLKEPIIEYVVRDNKVSPDAQVVERVIIDPGEVRCRVVPDTKAETLQPIIHANVCPSATIISDEWLGYNGLGQFYRHRVVDHMRKQYVNEDGESTNTLEGFWTWIKRAFIGIYHSISRKHMQRYADEVAFRYNTRYMKASGRMNRYLSCLKPAITFQRLTQ